MRTARYGLLILAVGLWSPAAGSATEASHSKSRRGTAVHSSKTNSDKTNSDKADLARTAPDVTATITKPVAIGPSPNDDQAVPPAYVLPAASRARVRACGSTWRDMKLAGRTGDDDWRDFAVKCFTAKDMPLPAQ